MNILPLILTTSLQTRQFPFSVLNDEDMCTCTYFPNSLTGISTLIVILLNLQCQKLYLHSAI